MIDAGAFPSSLLCAALFVGSFFIFCPPLQVLGGVESRGVLKKISDMLEVILKRIDNLSKLDNTSATEARRLDELSSAISRYAHSSSQRPCPSYAPCRPSADPTSLIISAIALLLTSYFHPLVAASGTAYYPRVPADLAATLLPLKAPVCVPYSTLSL